MVTVGTLCGCRSQDGLAQWGRLQSAAMRKALGFTREKTPCASTLHENFATLDVASFEAALRAWAGSLQGDDEDELRAIAIDGKTVRGTVGRDLPGVHVLSAFNVGRGLVLASAPVEKTNEAKSAEGLLADLDLKGASVTGDAPFAHNSLCTQVTEQQGHFVLAVKDNQPSLKEAIALTFDPPDSPL